MITSIAGMTSSVLDFVKTGGGCLKGRKVTAEPKTESRDDQYYLLQRESPMVGKASSTINFITSTRTLSI